MSAYVVCAIGTLILIAALGFPGWQWVMVIIGVMTVLTIAVNMWMAWEATR